MPISVSLVLGLVEGLTEFLPISSTFHLILAARLLQLPSSDFLQLFEVTIQSGAILAIAFLYAKTLVSQRPLLLKLLASFLPTALIGALLYPLIKSWFFTHAALQIGAFILVALIFLVLESRVRRGSLILSKHTSTLDLTDAFLIGVAQAFSVVPGVSRAGAVLICMLFLGYRRDQAAEYTFLLSLPTIFAATALDLFHHRSLFLSSDVTVWPLLCGTLAAFVSAYLVMRWLLSYLHSHTLEIFAWYRLLLAPFLWFWLR